MNQPARTTRLAWLSLTFALVGLLLYGLVLLAHLIPSIGPAISSLNVPNWFLVGYFLVAGGLALLFGIGAIIAIIRGRHGWAPTIVGVLIGLFEIVLGLSVLALSNLQLNIGPF